MAISPTAFAMALARVLNAFHCLQASMVTTFLLFLSPSDEAFTFELSAGEVIVVEVAGCFFLATVFFALTGASFLGTTTFLRLPAMVEKTGM